VDDMTEKRKWIFMPREKRKKAIMSILQNKKDMTLSELIRNHHKEIGVIIGDDGKVYHQPWEIVRNDCKILAKEGKLILEKGKFGRINIHLMEKGKSSSLDKITKEIHQELGEAADYDMIIDSINAIKNKISKVRGEIMEIWKLLSKVPPQNIQEKKSIESLISSLEELVRKYKL